MGGEKALQPDPTLKGLWRLAACSNCSSVRLLLSALKPMQANPSDDGLLTYQHQDEEPIFLLTYFNNFIGYYFDRPDTCAQWFPSASARPTPLRDPQMLREDLMPHEPGFCQGYHECTLARKLRHPSPVSCFPDRGQLVSNSVTRCHLRTFSLVNQPRQSLTFA